MNDKIILHITHTDIRYDSRILKELDAVNKINGIKCVGIGFELDEGATKYSHPLDVLLKTFKLKTRIVWLPRPLRYTLNFFELRS